MGLSKTSVELAWYILNEINPKANNSFIQDTQGDEAAQKREDKILGFDKKSDGGYENVFMNVRNISEQQLEIWERRKGEIGNSPFSDTKSISGDPNVRTLGWF
ncbi:MAG: hypothetical protein ACXVC2_12680 [Bacteroidia bacterium]